MHGIGGKKGVRHFIGLLETGNGRNDLEKHVVQLLSTKTKSTSLAPTTACTHKISTTPPETTRGNISFQAELHVFRRAGVHLGEWFAFQGRALEVHTEHINFQKDNRKRSLVSSKKRRDGRSSMKERKTGFHIAP